MKEQQKQIFLSEIQDPMTSRKGFIDLNVPYNSSNRQLRVQQLELLIQRKKKFNISFLFLKLILQITNCSWF